MYCASRLAFLMGDRVPQVIRVVIQRFERVVAATLTVEKMGTSVASWNRL
jgi:hypothetical protein